jgi:hypothetical protein
MANPEQYRIEFEGETEEGGSETDRIKRNAPEGRESEGKPTGLDTEKKISIVEDPEYWTKTV